MTEFAEVPSTLSMWNQDYSHDLSLPPSMAAGGTFSPRDWLNTMSLGPAPVPVAAGRLDPPAPCDTDYFADWALLSAGPVGAELPDLVAKAVAHQSRIESADPTLYPSMSRGQAGLPWYLQPQQNQFPFPTTLTAGPSTLPPTRSYVNSPSISPSALQSQSSTPAKGSTAALAVHLPSPPSSPTANPSRRQSSRTHPPKSKKRRASSLDTTSDPPDSERENEHEIGHEHEIPESVERDGMIWGMRVEHYRALGARDRKKVRNRISARTFRAKRKEHLSSLKTTLDAKDRQVKSAQDEAAKLRAEVSTLKRKLAQYGA